ncbi:hypothetical protein HDK77DRAFT_20595 [Phyllosticta capitalensis]
MGSHQESPGDQNALDVIFTCDICQASISDLYQNDDSATDFQDGRSEGSDRRVTSLWLTSCMHLTCGTHLEGGGAPFHPKGEHPQAPCPVCTTKSKDDRPRKLYAVRGWEKGSYDEAIPEFLFQAPPVQFDGQDPKMEALNFQYQSLVRYSIAVRAKFLKVEEARRKAAAAAKHARAEYDSLVAQNNDLKLRMAGMEKDAALGVKLAAKMSQVTHYLTHWPKAMDEINLLRDQLERLGYAVPKHDYSLIDQPPEMDDAAKDSAVAQDFSSTGSNRKRKRSPMFRDIPTTNQTDGHHTTSMAPPKALFRVDESKLPRRNLVRDREQVDAVIPARHKSQARRHENRMWNYDDREAAESNLLEANAGRQRAAEEEYMMTGAIPHESPRQAHVENSRLSPQIGRRPLKSNPMPQRGVNSLIPETPRIAVQKHTFETDVGASHGHQNGIPVRHNLRQYYEQVTPNLQRLDRPQTRGQEFAHQNRKPQQELYSRRPPVTREAPPGPVTPLPRKIQAPGTVRLSKSGSSPFFKRGHHESAMPGLSANARMGSVSKNMQNLRMTPAQQGWDKPRTLNGLSFIRDPRGTSNELLHAQQVNPRNGSYDNYSMQLGAVRPSEAGLFKRPEPPQQRLSSSYFQNGSGAATNKTSTFQPASRSQLRPSHNPRIVPPSADHEALHIIQSSRNAAATPSFYQNQIFDRNVDHAPSHPQMESRGLFSSMGRRRTVRR